MSDAPAALTLSLIPGDCRAVMRDMAARGILFDAIVTDPPYDLTASKKGGTGAASLNVKSPAGRSRISTGFMSKEWDGTGVAFDPETWRLALAVLKPGGHLLAFGGTRTVHRMACAIEDAGFEVRDRIRFECSPETKYGPFWDSLNPEQRDALMELLNDQDGLGPELSWSYGSGFPKSHDVSLAIDRMAGAEREVIGPPPYKRGRATQSYNATRRVSYDYPSKPLTAPTTEEAMRWKGWGTSLKPAYEPIIVARKPLQGTVAANVLAHGTGALNIAASRIPSDKPVQRGAGSPGFGAGRDDGYEIGTGREYSVAGRWPANVVHDGSDEVLAAFAAYGETKSGAMKRQVAGYGGEGVTNFIRGVSGPQNQHGDAGTAARFFYNAKANARDRFDSKHPTVKPVALLRYLVRLATPPGGVVLDPFAGTGTTLQAAAECGFSAVGIEREEEYQADTLRRIARLFPDPAAI